jgi:outer membrane autotransporter protein
MICRWGEQMGHKMNHRLGTNVAAAPAGTDRESASCAGGSRHKGAVVSIAVIAVLGTAAWDSAWAQCTTTASGTAGFGTNNALILNAVTSGLSSTSGAVLGAINTMDTAFLAQGSAFVATPSTQKPDQVFSGVWLREVGGHATTSSTGTVNSANIFGVNVPGTTTCPTKVGQEYGGVQAGVDLGKVNLGGNGANIYFGLTGGYAESTSHDNAAPNSAGTQALFGGGYATLSYGSFFTDVMVRGNFYQMQVESPMLEMHDVGFKAHGISVSANAGYNIAIPKSTWFVEPSVGIVYSVVNVDPVTIPGNFAIGGLVSPGFVQFDQIKSTLGRAGVRIGTNLNFGMVVVQPFLTASAWHEFQGDSAATYNGNFAGFLTSFQMSNSRLGTYGQYSAGAAAQLANSGWAGYARLDLREGSNIEGIGVNGGLRYSFNP